MPKKIKVHVECRLCNEDIPLKVRQKDIDKYMSGEGLIQDIFPYLTAPERELIKSGTCGDCWKEMFGVS